MKLSKETLSTLKGFSSINQSIYVNAGSELRTIDQGKKVMAAAKVSEEFVVPFGIYDLAQFLGAVSLIEDPDFDFGENSMKISAGGASITYVYANRDVILQAPSDDLTLPDVAVEFDLSEEDFKKTARAASVLQLPNWTVVVRDSNVSIEVGNREGSSGNAFVREIGKSKTETADVDLVFKVSNLLMALSNNDYSVKVSSKGISHFTAKGGDLQYFIATETR